MSHASGAQYSVLFNPGHPLLRTEYEEDFSLGGNKLEQAARWRNATRKVEYGRPFHAHRPQIRIMITA